MTPDHIKYLRSDIEFMRHFPVECRHDVELLEETLTRALYRLSETLDEVERRGKQHDDLLQSSDAEIERLTKQVAMARDKMRWRDREIESLREELDAVKAMDTASMIEIDSLRLPEDYAYQVGLSSGKALRKRVKDDVERAGFKWDEKLWEDMGL